jgi:hypothetical protein
VFFRNRSREWHLLANGEAASGYVTAQKDTEYTQSIEYCFRLPGGRLGMGRYNEGMTVPVLYDPDNPSHGIPLDCSLTKIG